jgi:hypothetical protein
MPKWNEFMQEAGNAPAGFDPLPVGQYDVEITDSKAKVTQNGKAMYEVKMKVLGGPHANRLVWNRFVISPESSTALSIFFQQMKSLGVGPEFFAAEPSDDQVAAALMGKRCKVHLEQKEYQGTVRNEVKKIIPPEGGAMMSAAPAVMNGNPNVPMNAPAAPVASADSPSVPF